MRVHSFNFEGVRAEWHTKYMGALNTLKIAVWFCPVRPKHPVFWKYKLTGLSKNGKNFNQLNQNYNRLYYETI